MTYQSTNLLSKKFKYDIYEPLDVWQNGLSNSNSNALYQRNVEQIVQRSTNKNSQGIS